MCIFGPDRRRIPECQDQNIQEGKHKLDGLDPQTSCSEEKLVQVTKEKMDKSVTEQNTLKSRAIGKVQYTDTNQSSKARYSVSDLGYIDLSELDRLFLCENIFPINS